MKKNHKMNCMRADDDWAHLRMHIIHNNTENNKIPDIFKSLFSFRFMWNNANERGPLFYISFNKKNTTIV